ncbi:MAG: class I SAM-dependent methyltransferase, partial [Janthinobacterium lividum]
GSTRYSGRIAVLHIDGNHAYENAKADVVGWTKLVTAGGWIVIDDYVWPWGDGPQRAGDELLAAHPEKIGCVFVMGTALFIQLRDVL